MHYIMPGEQDLARRRDIGVVPIIERHPAQVPRNCGILTGEPTMSCTSACADLTPGLVIRTQPRMIMAKEIVEFATRFDPRWFHTDVERARNGLVFVGGVFLILTSRATGDSSSASKTMAAVPCSQSPLLTTNRRREPKP
jgi:hypothetical protein